MAIKRDAAGEAEETRTLAQEVARRSVSQLEGSLARITAEAAATGRWLFGALIVLNGGGMALTAASAAGMKAATIVPAMVLFIFGAALTVVAALVSAGSALFMARPIGEASGQWAQVGVTGDISDEAMKATKGVRQKGLIWTVIPLVMAIASLMLFTTGALTLADGVSPPEQPEISAAEAALANAAQAPVNAANVIVPAANVVAPATPTPAPTPQATQAPVQRAPAQRAPAVRRPAPQPQQRQPVTPAPTAPAPVTTPAPTAGN